MPNKENNTFYQRAMQCGTLLGLLWIAMYTSCIAGFANPFFVLLFMALNIASPFYAGYMAIKYRRTECNNILPYSKAFLFVLTMYICASMLSALAHFIYFEFFDNGYFVQLLMEIKKLLDSDPQQFGQLSKDFNDTITLLTGDGMNNMVLNILTSNISNGTLLSLIIAIFVKRSNTDK